MWFYVFLICFVPAEGGLEKICGFLRAVACLGRSLGPRLKGIFRENKKPCPPLANRVSGKIGFLKISGYNAALFTSRVSFGLLSTLPGMLFWQYHALRIKPAPSHPNPLKRTIPMARATVAVRIEMECDSEFIEVECADGDTRHSTHRQYVFNFFCIFLFY
jgi:hypothetical protein